MLIEDRGITIRRFEIAASVYISFKKILEILYNRLVLSKVSARWIPRLLGPEQKLNHVEIRFEPFYRKNMGIVSGNESS